jgi:hypothetical protein
MRRTLGYAVVATVVGAGVAWYGTGRAWRDPHPAGVRGGTQDVTGGALHPTLTAVVLVALAAAGALLVLGGIGRVVLGGMLAASGLALLLIAGFALADGARVPGPVLVIFGALLIADAGGLALLRGRAWPRIGGRYERVPQSTGPSGIWDALDRGEDPTR